MAELKTLELRLNFGWAPVLGDDDEPYTFPSPLGFRIRSDWAKPAIYRWTVTIGGRVDAVHIGEADDLSRRIYQYLNPGASQHMNARVKSALAQQALRGAEVTLAVLSLQECALNGVSFGKDALKDSGLRRTVENLLSYEARKSGIRTL